MRQLGTQTITNLLACNKELFLMQTITLINQKGRGEKTSQKRLKSVVILMSDKLTDFKVEILKALRKHNNRNTAEQFSMDEYYNNLQEDVTLSRFKETLMLLEDGEYIKKITATFNDTLGYYEIAPKGLRYLINLDLKK